MSLRPLGHEKLRQTRDIPETFHQRARLACDPCFREEGVEGRVPVSLVKAVLEKDGLRRFFSFNDVLEGLWVQTSLIDFLRLRQSKTRILDAI